MLIDKPTRNANRANLIQDGLGNTYRYDGQTSLREVQTSSGVLQTSTFNANAQRKTVQITGGLNPSLRLFVNGPNGELWAVYRPDATQANGLALEEELLYGNAWRPVLTICPRATIYPTRLSFSLFTRITWALRVKSWTANTAP